MTPKTRTITLTGRAPVRINEDAWPVLATGWERKHDGEVECGASRKWAVNLFVRQHGDGRAIVYGAADYDTHWQHERNYTERAGALIDAGADIAEAIEEVGHTLASQAPDQAERIARCVRECVAALPAEVL